MSRSRLRCDLEQTSRATKFTAAVCFCLIVLLGSLVVWPNTSQAQGSGEIQLNVPSGEDGITNDGPANNGTTTTTTTTTKDRQSLNLLSLITQGGLLMIPIMIMSVLVIAIVFERFFGLSERKVLPRDFVNELGVLAASPKGFEPKEAYRICQEFPSSASTVIRSMLLKVGRPLAEVERAVTEASDREASRLYENVRWLNLVAAVAPLIGLFGTVWGMIKAFFETSLLTAGQNKSVVLAEGIYVALVTTLGGLAVAIPAAVFSHYFEGRIQNLFYQIDELLFTLMPQIERYEGRLRMSRKDLGGVNGGAPPKDTANPPAAQPQTPQS